MCTNLSKWLAGFRSAETNFGARRRGAVPVIEPVERRMMYSAAPLCGEFRINSSTSGDQLTNLNRDVAADAAGNFAVTWQSSGQDGSGLGIYAQRYNAAGVAQGGEFRVNSFT